MPVPRTTGQETLLPCLAWREIHSRSKTITPRQYIYCTTMSNDHVSCKMSQGSGPPQSRPQLPQSCARMWEVCACRKTMISFEGQCLRITTQLQWTHENSDCIDIGDTLCELASTKHRAPLLHLHEYLRRRFGGARLGARFTWAMLVCTRVRTPMSALISLRVWRFER